MEKGVNETTRFNTLLSVLNEMNVKLDELNDIMTKSQTEFDIFMEKIIGPNINKIPYGEKGAPGEMQTAPLGILPNMNHLIIELNNKVIVLIDRSINHYNSIVKANDII